MEFINMINGVCEPDSTVETIDFGRLPRPPTRLDIVRQQYEDCQTRCTEMLANYMEEQRQAEQELLAVQRRREATMNELKMVQNRRQLGVDVNNITTAKLANLKQKLIARQKEIEEEINRKSSASIISEQDVEDLTERVAIMRDLLQARRQPQEGR